MEEAPALPARRTDFLAIALLVALVTAFFADVLFASRTFYLRDLAAFHYPMKSVIRRIVLGGEFPWWNPFFSGGQPMAANPQYEIFYAPQWLIFLPSFAAGFKLHILFHIYLLAISTYILLRSFSLGAAASLFGAISWALGGVVLSVITLLPTLFTAAWMPLLFLFVRRSVEHFRWRDAAIAGIVGGMQILAGEPAVLGETWIVIGGWAALRMWQTRRTPGAAPRTAARICVVFAWSVLIGSVQLVPAIEHVRETPRVAGLPLSQVRDWSFPPSRIFEIAQPYLFGYFNDHGANAWWGRDLYPGRNTPFVLRIYGGALILPLLLAGVMTRRTRRFELSLVAIPFLLLALGTNSFVVQLLYELHIPVPLRFPERFIVVVVFAVSVFAASILDRVLKGDALLRSRAMNAAGAIAALIAIVVVLSYTRIYDRIFRWLTTNSGSAPHLLDLSRQGWQFAFVATATAAALLFAVRSRPASATLWKTAIVATLALELFATSLDTVPRIGDDLYDEPPVTKTLDPHRASYRIFHLMAWYEYSRFASGFRSIGAAAIWAERNAMIPQLPATWGYRTVLEQDYDLTLLRPTTNFVDAMWSVIQAQRQQWQRFFLPVSNVRYIVVARSMDEEMRRIGGDASKIEPAEFVAVPTLPRYFFANAIRRIRGKDDFVRALRANVPGPRTAFADLEPFTPAPAQIRSVDERSSSIAIDVVSAGRSFLVMSMTADRHWNATIDGTPAPIVATDIAYQGIVVPPGEHHIALHYRNWLTIAFGIVSAIAFAAALIAAAIGAV